MAFFLPITLAIAPGWCKIGVHPSKNAHKMEPIPRLFTPPSQSFFLFGPRGTGKSTWLRQAYPQSPVIDLLEPENYRAYSARPERLREVVAAAEPKQPIILDEIQKVPALLEVVHVLLEGSSPRQFVLTGSSARKLRRAGVDLLAGRALRQTLHPFMAAELGPRFELDRHLRLGMLPLVLGADDPEQTLRSYAALYLREEVQAEGLVRSVGSFARFLEAISFSHASVLNTSQVARECEVSRKVVESYVEILEDLLLSFRLSVFRRRAQRQVVQHPKFFYCDAGIFRALRPSGPLDRPDEIGGVALEGLVAQHLRAWIAYRSAGHELYYWRTRAGSEVDFVIYGEDTFVALEVKNARTVYSADLRPLAAFLDDYPQAKGIFLYRGRERLKMGDVLCLPCEEFLASLRPDRPIQEG